MRKGRGGFTTHKQEFTTSITIIPVTSFDEEFDHKKNNNLYFDDVVRAEN